MRAQSAAFLSVGKSSRGYGLVALESLRTTEAVVAMVSPRFRFGFWGAFDAMIRTDRQTGGVLGSGFANNK